MATTYAAAPRCTACPRRIRYSKVVMIDGAAYGPTCGRRELARRAAVRPGRRPQQQLSGKIVALAYTQSAMVLGHADVAEHGTGRIFRVGLDSQQLADAEVGGTLECLYRFTETEADGAERVFRKTKVRTLRADGTLGPIAAAAAYAPQLHEQMRQAELAKRAARAAV